jgi:protein PhnA
MSALPPCPKCNSEFTYEDGTQLVCPECAHEWTAGAADAAEEGARVYKDSVGNILQDGDTVTVIKDLKLKGGGGTVKWAPRSRTSAWSTATTISTARSMALAP